MPQEKTKKKNAPGHHQKREEERKLTQHKYWVSKENIEKVSN